MTRKDRMCLCKRRYDTEQEAANWIAKHPDPHGRPLRAYRCPYCGFWHKTHKSAKRTY